MILKVQKTTLQRHELLLVYNRKRTFIVSVHPGSTLGKSLMYEMGKATRKFYAYPDHLERVGLTLRDLTAVPPQAW